MRTSFFWNAGNAGVPHRGCIINAGPTWVTRIDNTLVSTLGCIAMLPKMAASQRYHSEVSRVLSMRDNPH